MICALCFEFVNWVVLPLFVCPPFPFFWAPGVFVDFLYVLLRIRRSWEHFRVELKDAPRGFCSQISLALLSVSFLLST
jgi:hypothetical protein